MQRCTYALCLCKLLCVQLAVSCILGAVLATLVIAAFQSTVVYGILLYSGEGYLQTMVTEFNLRQGADYWGTHDHTTCNTFTCTQICLSADCMRRKIHEEWTTVSNAVAFL